MRRGYIFVVGAVALVLGLIIIGRGVAQHASLLYDGVGVLFVLLGAVRLLQAARGGQR